MCGQTPDVRLINQGLRPWMPWRPVIAPVENLAREHALRPDGARTRTLDCRSTRIQQQPFEVKQLARFGLVWTVNAVCVQLPGTHILHPDVPDIAGPIARRIELDHPARARVLHPTEELEPHPRGI